MDPTRRALSGLVLPVAVPAAVVAAVLLALLCGLLLHLRVLWELGKLLARGARTAAGLLRKPRRPLPESPSPPAILALPQRAGRLAVSVSARGR
jgi:hypothetical protein